MTNLKKFFVVISLSIILAGTALADCPRPNPGEDNGPPCTPAAQLTADPTDQVTSAATISNAIEGVVVDFLIDEMEDLLTVY